MNTSRLLFACLLLVAGTLRAAAQDAAEPAFTSVPDPSSVQVYFQPPPTVDDMVIGIDDPWEPFNRSMYAFNAQFDRAVFVPVVSGYQWIMPDFTEKGASNFFSNLLEIRNFANNALQFRVKDTGVTGLRFVINTTVGIAGLWDPATKMGLNRRKEDFGQTLGRWGVAPGPYLVLPILGPSGLRDAGGTAFDFALASATSPLQLDGVRDDAAAELGYSALKSVDLRSTMQFRYYRAGSPFEYVLVRYAYTRMRQIEIER